MSASFEIASEDRDEVETDTLPPLRSLLRSSSSSRRRRFRQPELWVRREASSRGFDEQRRRIRGGTSFELRRGEFIFPLPSRLLAEYLADSVSLEGRPE